MAFEVRNYQEKHIDDIIRLLSKHRKVCAQLPTGGGKTVEFSKLAYRYHERLGKSVLILVHREELLHQTKATIEEMFGIKVSLIVAGTNWVKFCPVYIGMVESVNRRAQYLPEDIGLIIMDEAHNAQFNKLHNFFTKQYIIGFTATAKSSSKKEPMNKYYSEISVGPQIKELIKMGGLCQNITRSPKEVVDRAKLSMASTGDFDVNFMESQYTQQNYMMSTVINYAKYAKGKKAIVYNVSIKHSKEVAEKFEICGFPAKHVDGTTPPEERAEIFHWFKITPDAILCNVGVATMGFDEPTIEVVIVNRATASMPLWLQMCGRGSRPMDDAFIEKKQKDYPYPLFHKRVFTIIDMGGNAITHGDWCDERDWQYIFHNPERPPSGDGIAPVKECPNCLGIVHAAVVKCPLTLANGEPCGWIFDRKKHAEQEILGNLIIVTEQIDIDAMMKDNWQRKSYFVFFQMARTMIDLAWEMGHEVTDMQANAMFHEYMKYAEKWFYKTFPDRYFDAHFHYELGKTYFFKWFKTRFSQDAETKENIHKESNNEIKALLNA